MRADRRGWTTATDHGRLEPFLLYGESKPDSINRALSAAREILLDRIAHGELAPDPADAIFNIAE